MRFTWGLDERLKVAAAALVVASAGCGDSDSNGEVSVAGSQSLTSTGTTGASGGSAPTTTNAGVATSTGGGASGGSAGQGTSETTGGAAGATGGIGGTGGEGGGTVTPNALVVTDTGTCALDGQGLIHCWGAEPGVWSIPPGPFAKLYASSFLICGVREDGTVACFFEPGDDLGAVDFAPTHPVRALGVGPSTICAVDENGDSFCDSGSFFVTLGPAAEPLSALDVGSDFACGIRSSDSTLLCWGSPGDEECTNTPAAGQLEAPAGAFQQVSTGLYSSCAVSTDGELVCWGAGEPEDDPDQLCRGGMFNFGQSAPPEGAYRSVSVGSAYGCAVREDGTIACWGVGTTDECSGVECAQASPPDGVFEQVAAGLVHTCAMRADRTVQCWGYPGPGGGDGRTNPPSEFQ